MRKTIITYKNHRIYAAFVISMADAKNCEKPLNQKGSKHMFINGYRLVNIEHLAIIYIDRKFNALMGVFPNGEKIEVAQCSSAEDAEDKYYLLCETKKKKKNIINLS